MTQSIPFGYARIIHSLTLSGDSQPMAVQYGIKFAGAPPSDMTNVLNTLHDNFVLRFGSVISSTYTITGSEARWLVTAGGVHQDQFYSEVDVCTGAAAALPQNCAVLLHKRTASSSRRGRGRMFIPGIAEADVTNVGALGSGALTTWQNTANAFLNDVETLTTDVSDMVLLHSPGDSPLPASPTIVTSLSVDPIISTQRRRLRR